MQLAQRRARDLLPVPGDEPKGGIEALRTQVQPPAPLLEAARRLAALVQKRLLVGVVHCILVLARAKGTNHDSDNRRGLGGRLVHREPHPLEGRGDDVASVAQRLPRRRILAGALREELEAGGPSLAPDRAGALLGQRQ